MNARSDLMNDRERRTLVRLAVLALLAAVLCLVVSARQRSACLRARAAGEQAVQAYKKAEASRLDRNAEWLRWQEAGKDLEVFRTEYMYSDEDGVNALRLDLEQIFTRAGLRVSQIGYSYADMEKGLVKKMVATFVYSGSYDGFRKLLSIIERFPKFLAVEKLEFTNTGTEGGSLQVRMTLAGYYGI